MVYLSAERKTLSMTKNYVLQNEEKIKTFPDKLYDLWVVGIIIINSKFYRSAFSCQPTGSECLLQNNS